MKRNCSSFRRFVRWIHRFRHRCGYGIHSPFAFNLVTGVIYESGEFYAYAPLRKWRNGRRDPLREKDNRLLLRLANAVQPENCLIVGEETEAARRYLAAGCRKSRILSLPQADPEALRATLDREPRIDILYVGPGAAAEAAVEQSLPKSTDRTLMIVAGIHNSPSAQAAWQRLVAEKRVRVTFDLYDFGLAFFESRLNKQDYVINYF